MSGLLRQGHSLAATVHARTVKAAVAVAATAMGSMGALSVAAGTGTTAASWLSTLGPAPSPERSSRSLLAPARLLYRRADGLRGVGGLGGMVPKDEIVSFFLT